MKSFSLTQIQLFTCRSDPTFGSLFISEFLKKTHCGKYPQLLKCFHIELHLHSLQRSEQISALCRPSAVSELQDRHNFGKATKEGTDHKLIHPLIIYFHHKVKVLRFRSDPGYK